MTGIYLPYRSSTDKKINLGDHLSVTGWASTDLTPIKLPDHYRILKLCRYNFCRPKYCTKLRSMSGRQSSQYQIIVYSVYILSTTSLLGRKFSPVEPQSRTTPPRPQQVRTKPGLFARAFPALDRNILSNIKPVPTATPIQIPLRTSIIGRYEVGSFFVSRSIFIAAQPSQKL